MARDVLTRLHTSERLKAHVAALTAHHLRLGFLVHQRAAGSRRAIYDYLTACEPVEVDVTLLSVADRLATRGRNADEAIARHLDLARELLGEALAWRAAPDPEPLIRGDELAAELGIEPAAGSVSCSPRSPAHASPARSARVTRRSPLPARYPDRVPGMATDPDCLFCKIVAGEIPSTIVAHDERTISFMDINPATRGHALVIPRDPRRRTCSASSPRISRRAPHAAQLLAGRAKEALGADGVNLVNSCGADAWQTDLPLPHPRDPALQGRPAAAAVGAGAGRPRRDRRRGRAARAIAEPV